MASPPSQHRSVTIDGVELDVAIRQVGSPLEGTTPPLVWIHGLGAASTRTFADISQHQALGDIPSLLIDLPGSGDSVAPAGWNSSIESMAEVVQAVAGEEIGRPVVLLGHSMGGAIAIAAAHTHPDLVRQLIVAEPNLDPGIGSTSVTIARQSEQDFVMTGHARLVAATRRLANQGSDAARRWLPTLATSDPATLHRMATSLLAPREPTFRTMLEQLPMPVATIWGDQSPLPEPPIKAGPNLRGYVVRDAGHQMFDDQPDTFAEILARILGSSPKELPR